LYLTANFLGGYEKLALRLAGGSVKNFFDAHAGRGSGDLVIALAGVALLVTLARFLYQRKIFLRL
jgi:hypothetical protein